MYGVTYKVLDVHCLSRLSISGNSRADLNPSQGSLMQEISDANDHSENSNDKETRDKFGNIKRKRNGSNNKGLSSMWMIPKESQDRSRKILENLAILANPICLNHRWTVKILKEFYPSNPGLLGMNVNQGSSILIRLRPASDHSIFLPWYDIVGTLCHELTHNKIGPHDASFFKLMDEVYTEMEALPNYHSIYREMTELSGGSMGYKVYNNPNSKSNAVSTSSQSSFTAFSGTGHKLEDDRSGSLGKSGSTTATINSFGEIIRRPGVRDSSLSSGSHDSSRTLTLKEKMAKAALERNKQFESTQTAARGESGANKLGIGGNFSGMSDVGSYKSLSKEEMRKLVLSSVENRIKKFESSPAGNSIGKQMNSSGSSCHCNNSIPSISNSSSNLSNNSCNNNTKSAPLAVYCQPSESVINKKGNKLTIIDLLDDSDDEDKNYSSDNKAEENESWTCQICLDINFYNKKCLFCGFPKESKISDLDLHQAQSHDVKIGAKSESVEKVNDSIEIIDDNEDNERSTLHSAESNARTKRKIIIIDIPDSQ